MRGEDRRGKWEENGSEITEKEDSLGGRQAGGGGRGSSERIIEGRQIKNADKILSLYQKPA
jgi:hypothetical protein